MQHSIRLIIYAIALIVGFSPISIFAKVTEAETGPLLIRGGWLFDGISNTLRRNSGIVIQAGKNRSIWTH